MELGSAIAFLHNKTILITGATGFLAKILVEKILRVQPDVNKLYLLIRVKDNQSPLERLHNEIISKDLFRVLKEKQGDKFNSFISEKVAPIAGDSSLPNLGMEDIECNKLCQQIHAIIHVAATTRFDERYDMALSINTLGPANVIDFAKKCSKSQILIHLSTAYVCGEKTGLVPEEACKMGETLNGRSGLNIDVEKRLIDKTLNDLTIKQASTKKIKDTMRRLGQQRAKMYGWPNTYVFTKAMGEMLVVDKREELPVVILRPTMISSTYKDPFPGWIESIGSVAVASIVQGKKLVYCMHADESSVFDLIPADMVVNSILMAMIANAKRPKLTIYQVGSSLRNPITLGKLIDINYQYFQNYPWTDEQGKRIKVLNPRGRVVKSKIIFFLFLFFLLLELVVSKFVDKSSFHTFKFNHGIFETRLKVTFKMAEIFRPYMFFTGIFDDKNTEKLRITMRQNGGDKEECFNFDPICINWEDYLYNVHIPAIVKYLF